MQFYVDEQVDFEPTPDYIVLDKKIKKALNELEHFNIGEISKAAILN